MKGEWNSQEGLLQTGLSSWEGGQRARNRWRQRLLMQPALIGFSADRPKPENAEGETRRTNMQFLDTNMTTAQYAAEHDDRMNELASERGLELHIYVSSDTHGGNRQTITVAAVPMGTPRTSQARYQNMALATVTLYGFKGYIPGRWVERAAMNMAEQLESVAVCA